MGETTHTNIEQRQLMRAAIEVLAEPLIGDAKSQFLTDAEALMNRTFPAPTAQSLRAYLTR